MEDIVIGVALVSVNSSNARAQHLQYKWLDHIFLLTCRCKLGQVCCKGEGPGQGHAF